MINKYPTLYSFRRCPYAMRARLALRLCKIECIIREISLKAKNSEFLKVSPKGTVPVLVLPNGKVLEESLDIINWSLEQNDPLKLKINNQLANKTAQDNYIKGTTINGSPLSHISPINGHANIRYSYNKQKISFETRFAGQKRKEDYDLAGVDNLEEATSEGNPSWIVFNVSYDYTFDKTISVCLGIENIFDLHYKTFGSGISSSGRNFTLSLYTNF